MTGSMYKPLCGCCWCLWVSNSYALNRCACVILRFIMLTISHIVDLGVASRYVWCWYFECMCRRYGRRND